MFRFYCFLIAMPILLTVSIGCQTAETVQKSLSVAASTQDVVDAWDLHCVEFSFCYCPDNVLGELTCTATLRDMYLGGNFVRDCDMFMEAIQLELLSSIRPDPDIDDFLNAVLSDPSWFY